jgi:hypothetical protein
MWDLLYDLFDEASVEATEAREAIEEATCPTRAATG